MAGSRFTRDKRGKFTGSTPGSAAPSPHPQERRAPTEPPSPVVSASPVGQDYDLLWERARSTSRAYAYKYSTVTFEPESLVYGTVWAGSPEEARATVAEHMRRSGYEDNEFTITSVRESPDSGYQDACDAYRDVLKSPSGSWLLRESPTPDSEVGGWVAVNAVNEHLRIHRTNQGWTLTRWDAGTALTAPRTRELGVFSTATECLTAADAELYGNTPPSLNS